ncbi:hypothetical protein JX265_007744 [Neoarthrinium moseri]|uniref:NACHT domain-containing protein n=1 Tax=Neoarthrinium moseri TaxID=1658444 RepID=A0A9P9WJI9_9PEZI|nr:hypothetical protein JX265_007744 [Neoarthrinium moseri]
MDPLSALSAASAVVAFVDFGAKLLSRTRQLYKTASGETRENANLSIISDDLRILSDNIGAELSGLRELLPAAGTSESMLAGICQECIDAHRELSAATNKLRLTNNADKIGFSFKPEKDVPVNMFSKALMELQFDVDLWRRRLDDLRARMTTALLGVIWKKSSDGAKALQQLSSQQAMMAKTLTQIQATTDTLSQTIIQYSQETLTPRDVKHQSLVQDIWFSAWPPAPDNLIRDHRAETSYNNAIIASLKFQGGTHREESIPKAHEKTFEWIFTKPRTLKDRGPLWSDFTEWLQTPTQQIYWITGKPGAGKSTLMKFVAEHQQTLSALHRWSIPRPLAVAKFYSWNAGTLLQKSQMGLFRTLLWQVLSAMPTIAPRICPRRWALYKIFGSGTVVPEWSWAELLESFTLMLPLIGESFDLSIFIDGLDEFEGTHEKLIDFVDLFRAQPGAKICVSSRPWNVFLDAFHCSPSLKMEDITNQDIELFVNGRFKRTQGFQELEQMLPRDARKLINGIVTKAQGVFLWVSVVVNALCEGLTEGDKLSDLLAELERLPSDLEHLYSSIWAGVKWKYMAHSSQLFQILECAKESLDVVTLSLADDDNALDRDINDLTEEDRDHIKETMKRRLNSRTRGLIEVSRDGQIDYLHRSVRDWTVAIWPDIQAAAADFDPNLAILKALTVEISLREIWHNSLMTFPTVFWQRTCLCLYHASKVKDDSKQISLFVKVMDRLDKDLSDIASSYTIPDGSLPLYRNTGSSNLLLRPGDDLSHWASTQRTQTNKPLNVAFLGLAAQFAIAPYVKHKIFKSPGMIKVRWPEVTIIECAVFGFGHFCRPDLADLADRYKYASLATRVDTKSQGDQERELLEKMQAQTCRKVAFLESVSDADLDELAYWQDMARRLRAEG